MYIKKYIIYELAPKPSAKPVVQPYAKPYAKPCAKSCMKPCAKHCVKALLVTTYGARCSARHSRLGRAPSPELALSRCM